MAEFAVDPVGTSFMCLLYIGVGSVSVLCNLINLAIFLSTKEFRQKYLLFIVLDLGELVNAISYIATGLGRLLELYRGYLKDGHTVGDCFFRHPWPILLILGMQLPAITIVLIALERTGAILAPMVFKAIFMSNTKWIFISIIPVFSLISLGAAAYSAITDSGESVSTGHCGIITSTALWYSTYHFTFVAVVYLASFSSSFLLWYRFRNRTSGSRKLFVNLVIIGVSAILVALPSAVNILMRFNLLSISDLFYSILYALPGFLSISNTLVSFSLRPDVRRQFQMVCLKKEIHGHPHDSSSTPPITVANTRATESARHTLVHHT